MSLIFFINIALQFPLFNAFTSYSLPISSSLLQTVPTRIMNLQAGGRASQNDLLHQMSISISQSTGKSFQGDRIEGGMGGGGGGASNGFITDSSQGISFFFKSASLAKYEMLQAEFIGVHEMFTTHKIRVPKPIALGTSDFNAFVVFEKLSLGGFGDPKVYARKLVELHKHTSSNNEYGFKINNTIGATFQPNNWSKNWAEFWVTHRLGFLF